MFGLLKPKKRRKASTVKKMATAARLGAKTGVKLAGGKQERKTP